MSYGLMPYAVDIDRLTAICGSGDDTIRRAISGRYKRDIIHINMEFDWSNERGEPSVFLAIRHLIMGDEKNLEGVMYGYAFKFIVEFFGHPLDNRMFCPRSTNSITGQVDAAVKETGATVSMSDLLFRMAPVPFPEPDDFPLIGYWTADEIVESRGPLRSAKSVTPELETIRGWVDQAAAEGLGVVAIYH